MNRLLCFALSLVVVVASERLAFAEEFEISQKNKEFSKSEITIKPGDKLVFVNDDQVTHNVFCKAEGCCFNTKAQAVGSRNPITFEKEGTFEIRCAIHPKMKLVVTVKK
jgi:plastocyanin